jgi:hypothetical protein
MGVRFLFQSLFDFTSFIPFVLKKPFLILQSLFDVALLYFYLVFTVGFIT